VLRVVIEGLVVCVTVLPSLGKVEGPSYFVDTVESGGNLALEVLVDVVPEQVDCLVESEAGGRGGSGVDVLGGGDSASESVEVNIFINDVEDVPDHPFLGDGFVPAGVVPVVLVVHPDLAHSFAVESYKFL